VRTGERTIRTARMYDMRPSDPPLVPTSVHAPEFLHTARLVLRRPRPGDAEAVFATYASDPEVTHYLGWARHVTVDATRAFLDFSDDEWRRWPAGPYLLEAREGGALLGSTGLAFEAPWRAATGYALARGAWGKGYATEALMAMVDLARQVGVVRLQAICHVDHAASRRVLEKGGFVQEGVLRKYLTFPNLGPDPQDVRSFARILA
jgi:ribosomal-protein-alanine N-acetyltransferase